MIGELLGNQLRWFRICDRAWRDPTDDTFAQSRGGRWNPSQSWRTLYVNADMVTARLNVERFIASWPYEPEDLNDSSGPDLAVLTLPRDQRVVDAHTAAGIAALGLPRTYPLDGRGLPVEHGECRRIGSRVHAEGYRGVHCRSAETAHGAGRELAWFPATRRSRARLEHRMRFTEWFWG